MDRYKQNIVSTKKIISLVNSLDNVRNEEEKKIVKWIKEDIKEIHMIQNELKNISLLKFAYMNKRVVDDIRLKEYTKKEILKIYNIVNMELNNWRDINMCIQTCYNKIKIS